MSLHLVTSGVLSSLPGYLFLNKVFWRHLGKTHVPTLSSCLPSWARLQSLQTYHRELPLVLLSLLHFDFDIPFYSFIVSSYKSVIAIDIKSIVAWSTVSHISLMFIDLFLSLNYVNFHCLVHCMFKSLTFILTGSIIHLHSHGQSIYRLKLNHSLFLILVYLNSLIMIFSLSKENILVTVGYTLNSSAYF